ncbi:MAG: hypothetical protein H0W15_03420 [Gemmatimonadales bacterium]|nr:hypothetical protein [Gemmatimonadales bacterium]
MRSIHNALAGVLAVAACAPSTSGPRPDPAPLPAAPDRTSASTAITLRRDWTTTVTVEREDSIVITLPDGSRQVQRQGRTAHFTMSLAPGTVRVKLNDLVLRPSLGNEATEVIGTTWTGRVGASGTITNLQASRNTTLGDDISNVVRAFLPRLPDGRAVPGARWADSSEGAVRVEIFRANEHRTTEWSAGQRTERNGIQVLAVRSREEFEQLGRGNQAGRELTMTAQGRRTATYYLTLDGRVDAATLQDSVAKFITIADTRQSIPTMQFARTAIQYGTPAARGPR